MQSSVFTEKRTCHRFAIIIPIIYIDPCSRQITLTRTHDICSTGVGLVTEKELSPSVSLDIYLQMADTGEQIYRKGTVIWSNRVNSSAYRAGIRLEDPHLKPIQIVLRTIKAQRKY
jgi:hypothetical protein